jgi:hypothetical protein
MTKSHTHKPPEPESDGRKALAALRFFNIFCHSAILQVNSGKNSPGLDVVTINTLV